MARFWTVGKDRELALDRARILAIVNVTPDSFSDGGSFLDPSRAIAHALECEAQGADIIDIGGESTRPGAVRVSADEQIRRVLPVIEGLSGRSDVLISIDTTLSAVAGAAIEAGASIINDVSAGKEDGRVLKLAAQRDAGLILMHRGAERENDRYSDEYVTPPVYGDVVEDVRSFLCERVEAAVCAGVNPEQIVVDPGLGFGKNVEQNLELLSCIDTFDDLGAGVLSAASRKSFIGKTTGVAHPADRLAGSLAVSMRHWVMGVRLFRVHDVAAHVQVFSVLTAMARGGARTRVDGVGR